MAVTNEGNDGQASAGVSTSGESGRSGPRSEAALPSGPAASRRSDDSTNASERTAVDLRFLQTNERTFLAWIRTGIALMAFGFAVARISAWLGTAEARSDDAWAVWIGAALLALGMLCNVIAAIRYVRIRAAIVEGRTILPGHATLLTLAVGLTLLGGLLAVHVVIH